MPDKEDKKKLVSPQTSKKRPEFSQAYITRTIQLKSRIAQHAYRRTYLSVSDTLYILSVVFRQIGTPEQVQQAEFVVANMIETTKTMITKEIKRLENICEDNAIVVETSYTHVEEINVKILTPRGGEVLNLLLETDKIITILDIMWFSSLLKEDEYHEAVKLWSKRIIKLANQIRNLTSVSIKEAKKKNSDEENKELETAIENAKDNLQKS